jgi:hypothetical protein
VSATTPFGMKHLDMRELPPVAQHRRQRANHQDNEGRIYRYIECCSPTLSPLL